MEEFKHADHYCPLFCIKSFNNICIPLLSRVRSVAYSDSQLHRQLAFLRHVDEHCGSAHDKPVYLYGETAQNKSHVSNVNSLSRFETS